MVRLQRSKITAAVAQAISTTAPNERNKPPVCRCADRFIRKSGLKTPPTRQSSLTI